MSIFDKIFKRKDAPDHMDDAFVRAVEKIITSRLNKKVKITLAPGVVSFKVEMVPGKYNAHLLGRDRISHLKRAEDCAEVLMNIVKGEYKSPPNRLVPHVKRVKKFIKTLEKSKKSNYQSNFLVTSV